MCIKDVKFTVLLNSFQLSIYDKKSICESETWEHLTFLNEWSKKIIKFINLDIHLI